MHRVGSPRRRSRRSRRRCHPRRPSPCDPSMAAAAPAAPRVPVHVYDPPWGLRRAGKENVASVTASPVASTESKKKNQKKKIRASHRHRRPRASSTRETDPRDRGPTHTSPYVHSCPSVRTFTAHSCVAREASPACGAGGSVAFVFVTSARAPCCSHGPRTGRRRPYRVFFCRQSVSGSGGGSNAAVGSCPDREAAKGARGRDGGGEGHAEKISRRDARFGTQWAA